MSINWQVYFFVSFQEQIKQLTDEVKHLRSKDPNNYKKHEKTKMLAQIFNVIFHEIAIDPQATHFNLGNTLGKKNRAWKRAKERMPNRYRLFFKYNSNEEKIIIAWMNDKFTIRKRGDKKDVYNVFLALLYNGEIPSNWNQLSLKTTPYSNNGRKI